MRGKLCQIEPWFLDFERNSDVGTQTIILELALLISELALTLANLQLINEALLFCCYFLHMSVCDGFYWDTTL